MLSHTSQRIAKILCTGILFWMSATYPAQKPAEFTLTSPAFTQLQQIPVKYTCNGKDISPPLIWSHPPAGTQSFVLIMNDPDTATGIWDHWLLANLPSTVSTLAENLTKIPKGAAVGKNSWGNQRYNGPCPPQGTHRYFFKLYALDSWLNLSDGFSKTDVTKAMDNHVLGSTTLMGEYQQ